MTTEATTERRGRADLHIHTLASDGVSSVAQVIDIAIARGLDVIAITDHERVDSALAAKAMVEARGLPIEIVVGEEVSTRGGHVIGLFINERIRPWGPLRSTIAQIHEQGGLAIVAHPLVPYPLTCASGRAVLALLNDPDPAFHPDGVEAFNPTTAGSRWGQRAAAFVAGLPVAAVASSDAHCAEDVGQAFTTFEGRTAADLRAAIENRSTQWEGTKYSLPGQLSTFRRQLAKYSVGVRDNVRGKVRRDGTGRDLGYPGGRMRPPRLDLDEAEKR
ncbi:MAG TPA: PHP-associated domain-containing protein [Candidatus Limnocylindrales bacterium]|nr:PHP-associated domain-containing protein [Candidatus Limnocylindrales bacterium]